MDQPDDREPSDPSGKKLDKELKQGSGKSDMAEPLSQYDLNNYPSTSRRCVICTLNSDGFHDYMEDE